MHLAEISFSAKIQKGNLHFQQFRCNFSALFTQKNFSPFSLRPPFLFIKVHKHLQLAESLKADLPVRWNCTKNNSTAMGKVG
jgi:hypothetical protein